MATVAQDAQSNVGPPAGVPRGAGSAPAPVVRVRQAALAADDPAERFLKRQVPAWITSGGIHLAVMAAFLLVAGFNRPPERDDLENQVVETRVDDPAAEKQNFENTDVGLDPAKETNYFNDRIENVSVPGPFKPEEAVGITGAPDGPPRTVPPPPGFGGGQGGGVKSDVAGTGSLVGEQGGYLGGRLDPGSFFGGRSGATREKMVAEGGGNTASEAAVARGLQWLQRQQKPDGRWVLDGDYEDDAAAAGLALLPFLAAGQTHKPMRGEKLGPYARTVQNGLDFLRAQQKPNGCFVRPDRTHLMYGQAIATMAVCEAYGMTRDPALKRAAQLGIDFLVKLQYPDGGWRYGAYSRDHPLNHTGDTSVTGWCLQAVKSGQMAGLKVPAEVLTKVGGFLDKVQLRKGAAYGYTGRTEDGSVSNMTAVGLLCRQYLGWGPKRPELAAGVEFLKQRLPGSGAPDIYYQYYATQVLHFYGGDDWAKLWNPRMRDLLVNAQDKSPAPATNGSWAPDRKSLTGRQGGRLTATSLSLLTLEVYYRHLPLYQRDNRALQDLD
jgi:hypothetical protein